MPPSSRPRRERPADRLARDAHVNVLIAAGRFTDGMDAVCKDEGLTHQQYTTLWVLCLADGGEDGIPTGAVADGLLTRAADTTRLVDRLERMGLAERLPNPADRRGVLVRATAQGRKVFARLTPRLLALHRAQWSGLTQPELRELNRLLAKALWEDDPK